MNLRDIIKILDKINTKLSIIDSFQIFFGFNKMQWSMWLIFQFKVSKAAYFRGQLFRNKTGIHEKRTNFV